ncbi:hypothetical protein GCM10010347_65480 [Streptomyces cirratus]|uniref:Uncharacterized protein n=1 Tax=Streptomyces cirratus TaxID=68187 RepID=A0ABQ3F5I5_9ACTN|nr:hypothetical protein GCM10010347_65480 [Streptomyces cirratus]
MTPDSEHGGGIVRGSDSFLDSDVPGEGRSWGNWCLRGNSDTISAEMINKGLIRLTCIDLVMQS